MVVSTIYYLISTICVQSRSTGRSHVRNNIYYLQSLYDVVLIQDPDCGMHALDTSLSPDKGIFSS